MRQSSLLPRPSGSCPICVNFPHLTAKKSACYMLAPCRFWATFPFSANICENDCLDFSLLPSMAPQRSENIFISHFN